MPWRKKALVALLVAVGAALVAAGAVAIDAGWPVVGAAVVLGTCVAAALALQAYWVAWDLSGASLRAGRPESRQVALTFDDGPGPDTPAVLDALDAAGVRATFFVLGEAARARPDLVREVARRGHLVAMHGDSHVKLHLAGRRRVEAELDRCRAAVRAAGVEPAPFFRAPHGFKGTALRRALRRQHLTLVGWTRGVWDTDRPGTETIVERACLDMHGGEILLLHDGCGTPGIDARRDQTAAAVPEVVRRWAGAGYHFVTIDRLESAVPVSVGHALRWAVAAALAVFAIVTLRRLDAAAILRSFAAASLPFLLVAALANCLTMALQTGRWLAIVRPVEPRARARDAFFALTAGYAIGLVVAARAADLARAHLMARRSGGSMAALTATAVVDHLLGSVALFGAVGMFTAVAPLPVWLRGAGTAAFAAAIAALFGMWLLRPRSPAAGKHGLAGIVARTRQGLVAVGRPRALAVSWIFALAGWSGEMLVAYLCLGAFGLRADVETSLLCVLATTLAAAAGVSPGNAGAFEIACVVALSGFGIAREPALAFAIGYHAVHVIPTALIGGGWLLAHGYKASVLREVQ